MAEPSLQAQLLESKAKITRLREPRIQLQSRGLKTFVKSATYRIDIWLLNTVAYVSSFFHATFIRTFNSQQFRPVGSGSKGISVLVMPLADGPTLQPHVRFKHLP
jgi:hypothetical protein